MPKYLVEADQLYCHSCYNPIHRFNFYWVWCESKARMDEFMKAQDESGKILEPQSQDSLASMYRLVIGKQDVPIICLPFKWERTSSQISSIIHEVIHSIIFFFRCREIPLPKDMNCYECDEENFCYFVDWLTKAIIDSLDNQDNHKYSFTNEIQYDQEPSSETGNQ